MGLREEAARYRKDDIIENLDQLEDLYANKVLTRIELKTLKENIQNSLKTLNTQLDRKIIDIRTLFEIGKELNSTLDIEDLMQIIIFTLMGQFQVSDVAVIRFEEHAAEVFGKRGFDSLEAFSVSDDFTLHFNKLQQTVELPEITDFSEEYSALKASEVTLVIPMRGKEKSIGLIALGKKFTDKPFTDHDKNFSFIISSFAGIALEKAQLYERLNQKYDELSTLYDVSKVINSTDDHELVLSLILETIITGFSVKKSLLFLREDGTHIIRKAVGLPENIEKQTIQLTEHDQELLSNNEVSIITLSSEISEMTGESGYALFVPLFSANTQIGGIFIFELGNYQIKKENNDLINLFAIIASQIAPPILMTQLIMDEKEKVQDPFLPLLDLMENEIEQADSFDLDVTFGMIKFTNLRKYIELYGGKPAFDKLSELGTKLKEHLPDNGSIIRYSSNHFLMILPAITEIDFQDFSDTVLNESRKMFGDNTELDIGINMLSAKYPDDAQDKYSILSMIE